MSGRTVLREVTAKLGQISVSRTRRSSAQIRKLTRLE